MQKRVFGKDVSRYVTINSSTDEVEIISGPPLAQPINNHHDEDGYSDDNDNEEEEEVDYSQNKSICRVRG